MQKNKPVRVMKYPSRYNLKTVTKSYINYNNCRDFFKKRGVFIIASNRDDTSDIASSFFLDKKDIIELKTLINKKVKNMNSTKIKFSKDQMEDVLKGLRNIKYNEDDDENTVVNVFKDDENSSIVCVKYNEYSPSKIDLIDVVEKKIEISVNKTDKSEYASLDFEYSSASEYKKVKEVIDKVRENNPDVMFNFEDISILKFDAKEKIQLFHKFLESNHSPWEIKQIGKLKIKKAEDDTTVNDEKLLTGIKTAILSGENLIENELVQSTIENNYYFSMMTIRFDHEKNTQYFDLEVDFKYTTEHMNVCLVTTGEYDEDDKELNKAFTKDEKDKIIDYFKEVISEIYNDISNATESIDVNA
ncbi:Uncharacterised protein [[Clostridium] sordellii]|uniref:hypothetical protein n=1 Tax=Paraclostridium sordellii TaxID=1505 RepID=UPI0005E42570|nr:hypothetical protein [Paeniclostridium sordellii]MBX9179951.1 hypothetical protein [Paeniclostridium sordellii]CEO11369.1 Uncharacterised protein [[Clostridium] sordellii] [Paeniclostridium sordellii]